MNLTSQAAERLIRLASRAIREGLHADHPGDPDLAGCPPELLAYRACFVTLSSRAEGLRGCRGVLEARRSLAAEAWHNAFASAFDDPRFAPVERGELEQLEIGISVLGPLQPVSVGSEQELLALLMPGQDGLVLAWRNRRATFLPKVWEALPEPRDFLHQLKIKAGLPADFWSAEIQLQQYSAVEVRGFLSPRAITSAPVV